MSHVRIKREEEEGGEESVMAQQRQRQQDFSSQHEITAQSEVTRSQQQQSQPARTVSTQAPTPAQAGGAPPRVCRFCHNSDNQMSMVVPCHCRGELTHAHANCVAVQVFQNHLYSCQFCHYDFIIRWDHQKTFREWLLSEETVGHQRRLVFSLLFAFTMAVVLALAWLQAARALARVPRLLAVLLALFLMAHTACWVGFALYNFWLYFLAYLNWKSLPVPMTAPTAR
ncbi:uncharacterized protein LOC144124316 [Amblyomma americanum]